MPTNAGRSCVVSLSLALCLAGSAACSSGQTNAPVAPPQQGTLTVDWSIDGTNDAAACAHASIATIELILTNTNGDPAGTFDQPCTAFTMSIGIVDGAYTATATPKDQYGVARAQPVPVEVFTIQRSDELRVPIEISSASLE